MHGLTRPDRADDKNYVYHLCPHNPKNPRHAMAYPQHARISVNEEIITAALARSWTPTCSATTGPPCARYSSQPA
jgi:hypothetical protein